MKKTEGNGITIFSHSPKNSKAIFQYIDWEYNKYENNIFRWHNFHEKDFIDYKVLKWYINYPEYQREDIFDPNKITVDSNRLDVIYDISNKGYCIGDYNNIPISSNLSSITDNICIEIKSEGKSFKNNAKKKEIFKIIHPNSKTLKSNIYYPEIGMEDIVCLIKLLQIVIYQKSFLRYHRLFDENLLKDASIILISDHGVGMPSIYYIYDFYSTEVHLAPFFIIINDRKNLTYEEQYKFFSRK